jgi:chromosomal replication initiator protein
LAVAAEAEPLPYNPLVLCGASGVGKTALAQALAAQRMQRFGLKSVTPSTGVDFARALANAIDSDSVADLRSRQQRCDILLLDDLHRLAAKPAAQQFLLHLLDVLVRRGSLVLVTLRQLPQATRGLLPGLTSRLTSGLVVPLAPPGPLARRELARQYASQLEWTCSDDVLARLADDGAPSAAPLALTAPHAVMQLAAQSQAHERPVRASQVAQLLAAEAPAAKAIIKQAAAAVAGHTQIPVSELKSKSRQQAIADARGLAMYVSRKLTRASYAEIGRQFGNRDHSTVLHACRKFEQRVKRDDDCRRLVDELVASIAAGEGG